MLNWLVTFSKKYKAIVEPYLKSFYIRASDPTHVKLLKLEILTNLASETSISIILKEFQVYAQFLQLKELKVQSACHNSQKIGLINANWWQYR